VQPLLLCTHLRDTLLSYVLLTKAGHQIKISDDAGEFIARDGSFALPFTLSENVLALEQGNGGGSTVTYTPQVDASAVTRAQQAGAGQQQKKTQPKHPIPRTTVTAPQSRESDSVPIAHASEPGPGAVGSNTGTVAHLAHLRYGHLCGRKLRQLVEHHAASGMVWSQGAHPPPSVLRHLMCDACLIGKMARKKFAEEMSHLATRPNDKAVADVLGPIALEKMSDGTVVKYSLSLITDVYSRNVAARIITSKGEASEHVISYYHTAVVLTGNPLKHLHCDGGKEYDKAEVALERRGVKFTRTPVDTPQRNAIAERKNRTLMEMTRALLGHARLDVWSFWQDALLTAVFVHNRVTVVAEHGKTMHELWTNHKPDLSLLRVFGCDAYVRVPDIDQPHPAKLAPRAEAGVFVGYDIKRELCYRVRLASSGRVVVSRDVQFQEEAFTHGRTGEQQSTSQSSPQQQAEAAGQKGKKRAAAAAASPASSFDPPSMSSRWSLCDPASPGVPQSFVSGGANGMGSAEPWASHSEGAASPAVHLHKRRMSGSSNGAAAGPTTAEGPKHGSQQQQQNRQPTGRSSIDTRTSHSHSSGSESNSSSSGDESAGSADQVDARTARKIASAARREGVGSRPKSPYDPGDHLEASRRSTRSRIATRQTGLNLDDFGAAVLATEAQVPPQASPSAAATVPARILTVPVGLRESDVAIPSTRKQAVRSPYASHWLSAMDAEYASLQAHHVWDVVPRPTGGINIVSCKWVYAVKCKDGVVTRFKARLVARGFTQQMGVDFGETYSPVLRYKTLRVILALVAVRGYELETMDVQTAYLNAPLRETVYMQLPDGYEDASACRAGSIGAEGARDARHLRDSGPVCLLRKALYGLKQAGREWNITLDSFVRSLHFTRCVSDACVYVRRSRTGRLIILSVYVDDIPSAYAQEDSAEWTEVKDAFHARFSITFLGTADWLLNMRISRDRTRKLLFLDQKAYTDTMLEEFRMDEGKAASTPSAQESLTGPLARAESPGDQSAMSSVPYRRAVGLLLYLVNTSRPDIAHAVHSVAQFCERPEPRHWRAIKQIMRYLVGTTHMGLRFHGEANAGADTPLAKYAPLHEGKFGLPGLQAFADADWAGDRSTRRSTSGWLLRLGGGSLIDWSCKGQVSVALSSCEAEYVAMSAATQAVVWLQTLLDELHTSILGKNARLDSSDSSPAAVGGVGRTQGGRGAALMGLHLTAPIMQPAAGSSMHMQPSPSLNPPSLYSTSGLVQRGTGALLLNDNQSALALARNEHQHQRTKHIDIRHHFMRELLTSGRLAVAWVPTHLQPADILTKPLPPSIYLPLRNVIVHDCYGMHHENGAGKSTGTVA